MIVDELKAKAQRKEKRRNVNFRIPGEIEKEVDVLMKQSGASQTAVLLKLIEIGLKSIKK